MTHLPASPAWHRAQALARAHLAVQSLAAMDQAQMLGHPDPSPEREWHRQQWSEMLRIAESITRAPGYRMEQEA